MIIYLRGEENIKEISKEDIKNPKPEFTREELLQIKNKYATK